MSILSNYEFFSSENNLNIYKKRKTAVNYKLKIEPVVNRKMNEWIPIPSLNNHSALRVKVKFKTSLLQVLKKIFYKDEQYWIYLTLSDQSIQKYRVVPKNAVDGIWLNPLPFQPIKSKTLTVLKMMFKASNQLILKDDLDIQFENIDFYHSKNYIPDFFQPTISIIDTTLFNHLVTFDEPTDTLCISWDKQKCLNSKGLNKSKSFVLAPEAFSPTFEIKLNAVKNIEIKSMCWINPTGSDFFNKLNYVFALEDDKGNAIEWNSLNIGNQVLNVNDWNLCSHYFKYLCNQKVKKLKVFLWNTSSDSIYLDDYSLKVKITN